MAKIAVVLVQGCADWEYALIAGTGAPFYGLDIRYYSASVGDLVSQGGLTLAGVPGGDELVAWQPDVVAVIGSSIWETQQAPDLTDLLRQLYNSGVAVAGICGGTLALARAGLLDAVAHTSNDIEFLEQNAAAYAGFENYKQSAVAISDERIISAAGTAPVSFTAAVFEAAGVEKEKTDQLRQMLAAEHA